MVEKNRELCEQKEKLVKEGKCIKNEFDEIKA